MMIRMLNHDGGDWWLDKRVGRGPCILASRARGLRCFLSQPTRVTEALASLSERMGKAYPDEARHQVKLLLEQEVPEDEIEKQTGVSDRTIRRWKLELERYGRIGKPPESRTGRHRVMNKHVEQALFDRVAQKPDMSVDDMLWWLYDTYKLVVGTRTIRRAFERRNTSHKKFRSDVRSEHHHHQHLQPQLHQDPEPQTHHHIQIPEDQPVVSAPPQTHVPVTQPDTTYQSPYAPLMAMTDANDHDNSHVGPDISPDLARALSGLTDANLHPDLMPEAPVELSEDEETLQLQLQQIMLQKKEVELKLKMRRLMRQRRESQTPNDTSLFDHLDVDVDVDVDVDPSPDHSANEDPNASPFDPTPGPKPRDSRSKSKVEEARKRTEERQERMLKDLERRSRRREHLTAEWVQSRDVWAKGPEKLLVQLMHQHSTYAYNQNSLDTFEAIFRELYRLVDHTDWYAPVHDDLLRERTRRKMSQLRTKMVKSGEIISRGEGYGGWSRPHDHTLGGASVTSDDNAFHISNLPLDLQPQDPSEHGGLLDRDALMSHDGMLDSQPLMQGENDLHHAEFDQEALARHQHELLARGGMAAHQEHMGHHQASIEESMAAGLQQDAMGM